ncbi:spore coat polysaccharide biosynthesis protein F [Candidatus Scalindua japonica]|uniref:Spore coat polysaccharide biosynthesis protein F n=2 Tax=Candidatus Scalindua japonica TaxID=1284222 RepID=A0A286U4C0_9BACT|nr:spore coat polysaccharide biosynthesis protein F [Candidatus Scalindua japonica]
MGSTRLPKKVLMEVVEGYSILGYLLKRLSSGKQADKIIVATTTNNKDDELEEWVKDSGYHYFRGSEADCLDRFYQVIERYGIDIVVRITSDCPLIIPEVVDEMIKYYLNNSTKIDYLSNRQFTNFPEGMDVEIFSREILEDAARNAAKQKEREHINYFFLDRPSQYRIRYYNHNLGVDYSRFKLSVDTHQELEQIRSFFKEKGLPFQFTFKELINVLIK